MCLLYNTAKLPSTGPEPFSIPIAGAGEHDHFCNFHQYSVLANIWIFASLRAKN